jgi:hypothetical protein
VGPQALQQEFEAGFDGAAGCGRWVGEVACGADGEFEQVLVLGFAEA